MRVFSCQFCQECVFTKVAAHLNMTIAYWIPERWCAALNRPPAGGEGLAVNEFKTSRIY